MGQLFYSMSLAMGIMITYGSYMKKDVNVEKAVHQIEIFDTGIAFLAGLMIIPAAFAFEDGEVGAGPPLMFETLPKAFKHMAGGQVIGALFFVLVLLAISLLTGSSLNVNTLLADAHTLLALAAAVHLRCLFLTFLLALFLRFLLRTSALIERVKVNLTKHINLWSHLCLTT